MLWLVFECGLIVTPILELYLPGFAEDLVAGLVGGSPIGCQKAVDFLSKYYGVRRMKVVLDGRRVGNGDIACYFRNRAYFTKRGLTKRTVLHEFYHHLVSVNGQDIPNRLEEIDANTYAQNF